MSEVRKEIINRLTKLSGTTEVEGISEEVKETSLRFKNGTETIDDILNYCRNFMFTCENGIKLNLVEKKYLDKIIDECKKLSVEREEDKNELERFKKENQDLKEENERIRIARVAIPDGYYSNYFISENKLVNIDTNKYFIEIEQGKFVDLKQVYLDNKNSILKQKIKDKIEELNEEFYKRNTGEDDNYYILSEQYAFAEDALKELLEE